MAKSDHNGHTLPPISGDNSKGVFERAVDRWRHAAIFLCGKMGRGGRGALQVAILLAENANRKRFYGEGRLVAWPAMDTIALWPDVNEKTMRRGRERLVKAGLVEIQHRFNDSDVHDLMIPPDAEAHLFECEAEIMRRQRERAKQNQSIAAPKCPTTETVDDIPKCPTTGPDIYASNDPQNIRKCPTTSESTSEYFDDEPSSLRSPDGSLARLEEREEDGRGRKEETEDKRSPLHLGHLPKGGEADASQTVDNVPPRTQRPTLAELKAKYGDNWGLQSMPPDKWKH